MVFAVFGGSASGFGPFGRDEVNGSIMTVRMVATTDENRRRKERMVQVGLGRKDGLKGSVLNAGAVGRSDLLCPESVFVVNPHGVQSAVCLRRSVLQSHRRKL